MVDEDTELVNAAGFAKTPVYNYHLVNIDPRDISKQR